MSVDTTRPLSAGDDGGRRSGLRTRFRARMKRDWLALFGEPWRAVRAGEWRRFWFGIVSPVLVFVLWAMGFSPAGRAVVHYWGVMSAADPWFDTLRRIPLSLFSPAHMLPCWTAMIQVALAFGCSQVLLGKARTITIGLAGHMLGTLSGRLWVWIGPPIGLARHWATFADAGPSVAVVALIAYLAITRRILWLVAALLAYEVSELLAVNGLSQREHVVGVLVGITAAALRTLFRMWRPARVPELAR
jgi:hypothetical protein